MTNRRFLAWLAIGHLANDWPVAALWLIVPAAGTAMGMSAFDVGLLLTMLNVGGALAYLPAGVLADRGLHRGRLLLATFWWVAAGYGLAALAPEYWSLALLLALAGMGNAAWHPIAAGVLTRGNGQGRAEALGVHAIGGSVAEILAPLAAGLMLGFLDWRAALALSALPTLVVGLSFIRVAPTVAQFQVHRAGQSDPATLLRVLRSAHGLRLVGMICLYNMALTALLSMVPLYLATVHGLSPAVVGVTFSAMLVVGAVLQPWVGRRSDQAGRGPVLVLGPVAAASACGMLMFEPPFWAMIVAIIAAVAALDAIRSTMLAAMVELTEEDESTTLGLAYVLMDGVGALGAVLGGLAVGLSWLHMFGSTALLSLGAALLALGLGPVTLRTGLITTCRPRAGRRMRD